MAKVNPEALEAEIAELEKQHYGTDPAGQPETPTASDDAPSRSEETAGSEAAKDTPQEQARGEQVTGGEDETLLGERLKNAQARMTRATQEAAELRRANAAYEARIAELERQAKPSDKPELSDDPETALAQLIEEYPDILKPVVAKFAKVDAAVEEIKSRRDAEQQQAVRDAHLAPILQAHPDLEQVVSTDDFQGWLERQTDMRKRVAREGNSAEVVELLDAYKADMGLTSTEPQKGSAVERAREVVEPTMPKARRPDPNAGKKIWSRSEISSLSTRDYERLEAEIDKAMIEGRVR